MCDSEGMSKARERADKVFDGELQTIAQALGNLQGKQYLRMYGTESRGPIFYG